MAKSSKPSDDPKKRKPANEPPPAKKKAKPRDEDDEEEEEDEEEEVVSKPKKKRKSKVTPQLISYIIGGILGFVLFVYLMYWVYTPVGADSRLLVYCPPDAIMVEGLDVVEWQKNTKMKEIFERCISRFKTSVDFERKFKGTGLTEKDVSYYLKCVAVGDLDKELQLDPQDRRGSLIMLRFKDSIDTDKFLGSFTDATEFRKEEKTARDGNTKYYRLFRLAPGTVYDISFFFPTTNTLIIGTTHKELQDAIERKSGSITLEETMRSLVDSCDGHYFYTRKFNPLEASVPSVMASGIADDELTKPESRRNLIAGINSWAASDGNYFLTGDGVILKDRDTAKRVYANTADKVNELRKRIYQEDAKAGDKENPFFVPKGAPGGGGGSGKKEDLAEGLTEYFKKSRVDRRGNVVFVEGKINQETFNKLWQNIQSQVLPQENQNSGSGPGMMMPPAPAPGPGPAGPGPAPAGPGPVPKKP